MNFIFPLFFRATSSKLSWSDAKSTSDAQIDAAFSASCLSIALKLLTSVLTLWTDLPSFREIFSFTSDFLGKLPQERISPTLWKEVEATREKLESACAAAKTKPIASERKKPKILRLYEPEIEEK